LDLTAYEQITKQGVALNHSIDDWIANILQKEMRTYQSNYMFEGRLLIKFKDFLNRTGKGNLPVTQRTKDVTKDYLQQWSVLESSLQNIQNKEVLEFNKLLNAAELPALYWPKLLKNRP